MHRKKLAVVLLAGTQSEGDFGRVMNALMTVREAADNGGDARLIFDGAGTGWVGILAKPDHPLHWLYQSSGTSISGACLSCAHVFGHTAAIKTARVPLLDEYSQRSSLRNLARAGFEIITF